MCYGIKTSFVVLVPDRRSTQTNATTVVVCIHFISSEFSVSLRLLSSFSFSFYLKLILILRLSLILCFFFYLTYFFTILCQKDILLVPIGLSCCLRNISVSLYLSLLTYFLSHFVCTIFTSVYMHSLSLC